MASLDVQTNIRLPAELKERLVAAATENGRSLSAEVAHRLDNSFEAELGRVVVTNEMGKDVSMAVSVPLGRFSPETLATIKGVFSKFAEDVTASPDKER